MNKFKYHVFVIPEDEADREIANGFINHESVDFRRIQVMPVAGGWRHVLATFEKEYIPSLRNHQQGYVVMLVDFDGAGDERMKRFQSSIPEDLKDRVFVIGAMDNPEVLRAALKLPLEKIGRSLAEACVGANDNIWDHEQLQHNEPERQRLSAVVRSFLFS